MNNQPVHKSAFSIWAAWVREPEIHRDLLVHGLGILGRRFPQVETEELVPHLHGFARGHALLTQAVEWGNPVIGNPSKTSEIRGQQWQLVMAVAGLEIILSALLDKEHPGIHEFQIVERCLKPLDAPPILAPKFRKNVCKDWIEEEKVLRFLFVRGNDLEIFKHWLVNGRPVEGLAQQLALAKAFRNCTVHGALSASKCRELGMQLALKQLPIIVKQTEEAILEVMSGRR